MPRTSYFVAMNTKSFLFLSVGLGESLFSAACLGLLEKAVYPTFGKETIFFL